MSSSTKQRRAAENAGGTWSKKDIADFFGVTPRCVTDWISRGLVPPPDIVMNRRLKRWRYSTLKPLIEGNGKG
jgi:hypothetical protein